MRVYEFAKEKGVTCASVIKMAEESDVEVYSALSQLEDGDVETLSRAMLRKGMDGMKAEAAAAGERLKAKAAKAAKVRAAKDAAQAEALEAARKRAIAAHSGKKLSEVSAAKPAAKSAAKAEKAEKKKKPSLEIGATLPEMPKVSIQVSEPDELERDVEVDDDDDEMDVRDFLHGKDLKSRSEGGPKKEKREKDGKDKKDFKDKKDRDGKEKKPAAPPPPPPAKPAAPAKPLQKPVMRVGGKRAGFASVSMRTARTMAPAITTVSAGAAQPPAPSKPTISMSVSTREISIRGAVVVKELALKLGVRPNRLIADLMQLKVLASINQRVEPDVATKVAQKYGYRVNIEHARDAANKKPVLKAIDADDEIPQDKPEQMKPRPPVVTFLGHVDHGKTTLMDYIRHTKVAAGEAGGITQQISAYQVDVQGRKITFLDTPGHAAFNAMRQRGAQLTDIAVIIIAADDGIMPQTEEAIKFARQAGVQIMVAITKCDKPTANPERVKQMLQKQGLTPEEWGGDIVCCAVSGVTGEGVDQLLEMILLQADVLELTANPSRRANGYVVEAELEQGFGPTAMLLVTGGTLKVGDAILIGEHFGKVRSLIDDHGRRIREAPPATPVKCTGLSGVPEAGAEFRVMLDEKRARTLAEQTAQERKEQELSQTKAVSFDDLLSQMGSDEKRELSVVVKSDTQGSLEAIVEALNNIKSEKVSLKVIASGTGNVSLTDVKSAAAGKAAIVGFDVGCDSGVQQQARHDGVRINSFRIIYELIDHVKKCMLDLLPPEYRELVKGHAVIKAVYDIGKVGKIAGSQMLDGSLIASARYRVLRGKEKIWEGKLQTLRHFKDEVKEVTGQQECGVCFAGFEAFAVDDVIECYVMEELPRTL
ncbi:MAG: translation initiation factor IF-2 [Kiritimatiellae bacterium]|nr:translation initiation factor IF-2 [Kiritimatiellia bacterium]